MDVAEDPYHRSCSSGRRGPASVCLGSLPDTQGGGSSALHVARCWRDEVFPRRILETRGARNAWPARPAAVRRGRVSAVPGASPGTGGSPTAVLPKRLVARYTGGTRPFPSRVREKAAAALERGFFQ